MLLQKFSFPRKYLSISSFFFLLKCAYKILCLTSFFLFVFLLQVVIRFPWYEKQSMQEEITSLVRQANVQKKKKIGQVFRYSSSSLSVPQNSCRHPSSVTWSKKWFYSSYQLTFCIYLYYLDYKNIRKLLYCFTVLSTYLILLRAQRTCGDLSQVQTNIMNSRCHPSPLWTVASYSGDPEQDPVWLTLAPNLSLHFSLILKQSSVE